MSEFSCYDKHKLIGLVISINYRIRFTFPACMIVVTMFIFKINHLNSVQLMPVDDLQLNASDWEKRMFIFDLLYSL